jgi:hypothetical protein
MAVGHKQERRGDAQTSHGLECRMRPATCCTASHSTTRHDDVSAVGQCQACTVDLRCVSTTLHSDADVQVGEALLAQQQDGLHSLDAQGLRLDQGQRGAIDLDQALASLAQSDGDGVLLAAEHLN